MPDLYFLVNNPPHLESEKAGSLARKLRLNGVQVEMHGINTIADIIRHIEIGIEGFPCLVTDDGKQYIGLKEIKRYVISKHSDLRILTVY